MPVGAGGETAGIEILPARLHLSRFAGILEPAALLGRHRHGVDESHGTVLAARVGDCDVEERGVLGLRGFAFELQVQGGALDADERRAGGHVPDLESFFRLRLLRDGDAVEQAGAHRRSDRPQLGGVELGHARVVAQEQVDRDALDGLLREDRHLGLFPVMRARVEGVHLAPQGRAVLVDEVEVQGVVAVPAAAHILGLAPGGRHDGLGSGLVERDRLGYAPLDLGVAAVVAGEDAVLFLEASAEGPPRTVLQQVLAGIAGTQHIFEDHAVGGSTSAGRALPAEDGRATFCRRSPTGSPRALRGCSMVTRSPSVRTRSGRS